MFDPKLAPGKRVLSVTMNGEHLDANRDVILATRDYMCRGKGNLISGRLEYCDADSQKMDSTLYCTTSLEVKLKR